MTPADFTLWLKSAPPGASCIYHTGCLATDRHWDVPGPIDAVSLRRMDVQEVAVMASGLAADGRAALFQRRVGDGCAEYWVRMKPANRRMP